MANLVQYTLVHNDKKDRWELKRDGSNRSVETFESKAEALKGGVLEKAMGKAGGSVMIQKKGGVFQQERTYPRGRDPRRSPG